MTPEWTSTPYPGTGVLHELMDVETGEMLGWVQPRPDYCDRGHWQAQIERHDLDFADNFPRYFMRLETAKQEMLDFVRWRYMHIRAEHIEKVAML